MSDIGSPTPPPPPPTPSQPPTSVAGFSQEQVNSIAAREKDEGKRAGQREVLETLGFKDADEAKKFMDSIREERKAKMSEAERAAKDAEEAEAKARQAFHKANSKLRETYICAALQEAGVPMAQTKMVAKMVELDEDVVDDEKKISEAVAELKKTMPNLFGTQEGGSSKPPSSHPAPPPRPGTKQPPVDIAAKAKEILHERHPRLKQQT